MSSPDELIGLFLGGDPIAGTRALHDLLSLGDAGEEALFSGRIEFPKTVQVRRRWLRYVASRQRTVVKRLLDRMQNQGQFGDAHAVAYLFAGLGEDDQVTRALYAQIETNFKQGQPTEATFNDYDPASGRFLAWGHAAGDSGLLWHCVSDSSFAWEKLRTFAFRGACAAVARINVKDDWVIEKLITHTREDFELEKIDDSPDGDIPQSAIEGQELWLQANDPFMTWRRGEVADEILRDWSRHAHWRVRDFGAQILASLGFQRTATPVIDWLRRERVQSVRNSLLHALARSETALGADVLIEHFTSPAHEGEPYLARAAWRASDKQRAIAALSSIANNAGTAGAEALVSLARLGTRHAQLTPMLDSHNYYFRLNAALAIAYLGDKSVVDRLLAMQREAANPLERICLAAALAMLGKPNGAAELNQELVTAAGAQNFGNRVDLFFTHRFLQAAALDGLAAGHAQGSDVLEAWRGEMEPLDPIARPVVISKSKPATVPAKPSSAAATGGQGAARVPAAGAAAKSLNVFISYSHQDEKMREKLGQHLAPLEDEGLIRIWHDREIEAGANWEGEINREISEADIILLLVSAAFLKSRYCRKELVRAIEQRGAGKALPIPIILRPCDWTSVFNRGDYKTQALPRDDRAVAGGRWPNQDTAFAAIAKELRKKIQRMRA